MRLWVTTAVALPFLTCVSPSLDLTIDAGTRCPAVAAEVVDDAVLPGWRVHALVALDPSGDEKWALATDPDARLMLQPLPGGAGVDLTALADTGYFELVPGPLQGEAWLLFDQPGSARVWRLGSAISGDVVEAPDLSEFFDAEVAWSRRLVFVGTTPYLLAAPNSGDASTLTLPIARLDREALAIDARWDLDFWWNCDGPIDVESGCMESPYEAIAQLEMLAVTQPDGAGATAVLLGLHAVEPSETPGVDGLHRTLGVSLELRDAGPDAPPESTRFDRVAWSGQTALTISQGHIAADARRLYIIVGVNAPPDAQQPLLQEDFAITGLHSDRRGSDTVSFFASFKKDLRSHLLQVGGEVALGQFLESEWRVAPIVDNPAAPRIDTDLIAGLAVNEGSVARNAGFGQFLIRPPQGTSRLVRLVCANEATNQ